MWKLEAVSQDGAARYDSVVACLDRDPYLVLIQEAMLKGNGSAVGLVSLKTFRGILP